MSNYEKYLQILNGTKNRSSPLRTSTQPKEGSPLRTGAYDVQRTFEPSSKYDFSRVEMPFNFRGSSNKNGGLSPPTIQTDENTDINSRSKLHTIDPKPMETRDTGFTSGQGSLLIQIEQLT